ncbi:MAG: c-type cytochrome [Xanthomonadales bacterium]|nr:c-type cytochrome [Xanthomonadales bacterium]
MKNLIRLLVIGLGLVLLSGCNGDPRSARGFRLPDGDAEAGLEAFIDMECNQCHTVRGEELPIIPGQDPPYFELGGEVTRVKTYGELVTSIINPSHKLATGYAKEVIAVGDESKMEVYNEFMTVQQLTDIVMFLQTHYDVRIPEHRYPTYPYP